MFWIKFSPHRLIFENNSREEFAVSWLSIAIVWIAVSVAAPMLYSWRYNYVRNYRERMFQARARLHRFHFSHDLPPTWR
jgi:hypothetical protein